MRDNHSRDFLIPISVVTRASRDGIPLPQLQDMLRRSARVTHPEGNRRYHDVVFMVEGQRVKSYFRQGAEPEEVAPEEVEPQGKTVHRCGTCRDDHRVQVFNECPYCEGAGCKKCDEGLVQGSIPCPDCTQQKPQRRRRRR